MNRQTSCNKLPQILFCFPWCFFPIRHTCVKTGPKVVVGTFLESNLLLPKSINRTSCMTSFRSISIEPPVTPRSFVCWYVGVAGRQAGRQTAWKLLHRSDSSYAHAFVRVQSILIKKSEGCLPFAYTKEETKKQNKKQNN
jgi:hypothetical protein